MVLMQPRRRPRHRTEKWKPSKHVDFVDMRVGAENTPMSDRLPSCLRHQMVLLGEYQRKVLEARMSAASARVSRKR